MSVGGISFRNLYGYANDGTYNYLLDKYLNRVFKFNVAWVFISSTILPFSSPYYLTYVSGNWFITGDYGIYKIDSTFITIVASATTGPHYGLYYYSTSSTIYAVKGSSVIEYTTGLKVLIAKNITGYSLWSITSRGNTFYIGTTTGLVLVMVDSVVTDTFNACNGLRYSVNSIVVQGTMMMTECYGNSYFYTQGRPFDFIFSIVGPTTSAKGVWIDLQNQLITTDPSFFKIYTASKTTTTTARITTRTIPASMFNRLKIIDMFHLLKKKFKFKFIFIRLFLIVTL